MPTFSNDPVISKATTSDNAVSGDAKKGGVSEGGIGVHGTICLRSF